MKIGIFDSGLGGLIVAKGVIKKMPQYDYVYLGDTKRLPYGNRSQRQIHEFLLQGIAFLFAQDCGLVLVACNTASASALRKVQQRWLPKNYPQRRVLGVIVPTAEMSLPYKRIGVLATASTVQSKAYVRELKKINPRMEIFQQPAPRLVPLIEAGDLAQAEAQLKKYLQPLLARRVQAIILGCTHYSILKRSAIKIAGPGIKILDQTEIIPAKLKNYLQRHPEMRKRLSRNKKRFYFVSAKSKNFERLSTKLFGKKVALKKCAL